MLRRMDDRSVGLVLRALRRRRCWRQSDLAARAGCSQSLISTLELGHLGAAKVETVRAVFAALGARVLLEPRWRGAELDRLVDAEHASVVEAFARRLERLGWTPMIEVTYSVYGERGSIDVLGVLPAVRAAIVGEVKTDIPSSEGVGRKLDEKQRLAPAIVAERLGWRPTCVGSVLVLPESARLRRLLTGPAEPLARMLPIDSRRVSSWLRAPAGPLAATWFLSNTAPRGTRRVARRADAHPARFGEPPNAPVSVDPDFDEPPRRILR
jgi:transcriptional regulator with XRE-family HTH domain